MCPGIKVCFSFKLKTWPASQIVHPFSLSTPALSQIPILCKSRDSITSRASLESISFSRLGLHNGGRRANTSSDCLDSSARRQCQQRMSPGLPAQPETPRCYRLGSKNGSQNVILLQFLPRAHGEGKTGQHEGLWRDTWYLHMSDEEAAKLGIPRARTGRIACINYGFQAPRYRRRKRWRCPWAASCFSATLSRIGGT